MQTFIIFVVHFLPFDGWLFYLLFGYPVVQTLFIPKVKHGFKKYGKGEKCDRKNKKMD
ncbi:hypothetical protein [Streptococcus dysgalactiae]|uniref:hypothetical protein n=1 Tax=Streptococcus dysgalactiae TaxID=1334 RepID=UPI0039F47ADA